MSVPITAALVKTLRERSSAGMMECKRALEQTEGDIEKAIEVLRKSGQAKADKKTGIAAEGIIIGLLSPDKKQGILMEINCQTDFVARDKNFMDFAHIAAQKALESQTKSVEDLLTQTLSNHQTIDETRRALISKVGENVQIRRLTLLSASGELISYIHSGRIGTIVDFEGSDPAVGKDIAMHITASNPLVLNADEIPAELIDKEKTIFAAQAQTSGKPADIIEKMVQGRIKKFTDEISLLGQPFVKNPDETVGKLLENTKSKVYSFIRFAVGEGIEKKTENFAEEVMAQARGS